MLDVDFLNKFNRFNFFFFDLFFVDDTDFSESEGLSSAQINRRIDGLHIRSPTSETEEESRDGKWFFLYSSSF